MATVAILIDRSFDDVAFQRTLDRLAADGHEVVVVGPRAGEQLHGTNASTHVLVDTAVDDVDVHACDALLVPGGVPMNHLRTHERMLNLVRDVYAYGKPVAVQRDDGWAMVRADAKARGFVSWPAVKRRLFYPEGPLGDTEGVDSAAAVMVGSTDTNVDSLLDAFLAQLERGQRSEDAATGEGAGVSV